MNVKLRQLITTARPRHVQPWQGEKKVRRGAGRTQYNTSVVWYVEKRSVVLLTTAVEKETEEREEEEEEEEGKRRKPNM